MKKKISSLLLLSFALVSPSLRADSFWDPDGIVVGSSVSGNWDTVTANWSVGFDAGGNAIWLQGDNANFQVWSDYTVTVTEPITNASIAVSGTNGTLTINRTAANGLTLSTDSLFNISGSRTCNLAAPLGGSFSIVKSGNGTLTMSAANTYSGGTTISSGSGSIGINVDTISSGGIITSGPLGTGAVNVGTAGHILFASGGPRSVENAFALNAGITIGGSQNLTFSNGNWQVIGGTRIITVNNSATTRLVSNLTDDGTARTLQKAGAGTLVLAGNNSSFLGPLTVNANSGTLAIGSDTALQVLGVVTVSSGGTLDLNGFNGKVIGLAGPGTVALGSGVLTIANAGTSRNQQGQITGSGSIIVSNSISQQMEGTNTFTGGILVKAGTLFLRTNFSTSDSITRAAGTGTITMEGSDPVVANITAALGGNASVGLVRITNRVVLASGRSLFFPSNGGTVQYDGNMSGPGGWQRDNNGSGVVVLTGSNTFSGGVNIESRVMALAHKNALGTGTFVIGHPINSPSSTITLIPGINLIGANAITNPTIVNQAFTITGTNDFELAGPMIISNGVRTLTTTTTGTVKFSGNIDGPGGFAKFGTSTLIFTGSNTYSNGDTIVNGGSLLLNNTTGSGTGPGLVTVTAGGTLGGTGAAAGLVTVQGGGFIAPGNSAGKLTLGGGLDLSGGGTYTWDLVANKDDSSGIAGTDFDQISLTGGNLTLGGAANLLINVTNAASFPSSTNAFWQVNHTWKIISLSGGAANPGSSNFGSISGTNDFTAGTFSTSVDGSGNVFLTFTSSSVPAPVIEKYISGAGTTNATIKWSSVNGVNYEVQYKNALTNGAWNSLGFVTASGATAQMTDTNTPVAPMRFYRVVVQ